jgi:site-specific recombinase XerD
MSLSEVIDAYIAVKTSLGMSFDSAQRLLSQFSREIGNPNIGEVQAEAVATFLRGRGALNATWGLKYRIISGFYKFAISRGHMDSSPLQANVPKLPPQQSPYVYSIDELRRLIEATSFVHIRSTPLQAPLYRMLLILLYGSGLRIGEALNLTLRDVDVIERIITVRDTKFFKTRIVPIGPRLAGELAAYLFRSSIPCLHVPLSTLRSEPHGWPRMTRGQDGNRMSGWAIPGDENVGATFPRLALCSAPDVASSASLSAKGGCIW